MNFEEKLSYLKSNELKKYLEFYREFHIEKIKCLKRKKSTDKYIETKNELIIEKSSKQKIIKKPEYIFIPKKRNKLEEEKNVLEKKINNFNFIVNYDTSKKVHEEFTQIKEEFLKVQNNINDLDVYLEKANNTHEKQKNIESLKIQIMEKENDKRKIYYELSQVSEEEKEEKIKEYIDYTEIKKLKKQLGTILEEKPIDFIINKLPVFDSKKSKIIKKSDNQPEENIEKDLENQKKSKKKIIKRCPKGERRNKKTGECEKKN
tara:strand:+ start:360 stop:1145 length:786 start_codon:yes stop_codon:yes gene_type:complete